MPFTPWLHARIGARSLAGARAPPRRPGLRDEVSPQAEEFIRSKRDTTEPPGEEVADFEESRGSTSPWAIGDPLAVLDGLDAMVFDDHDMHDDWNISRSWLEEMRSLPWWEERRWPG